MVKIIDHKTLQKRAMWIARIAAVPDLRFSTIPEKNGKILIWISRQNLKFPKRFMMEQSDRKAISQYEKIGKLREKSRCNSWFHRCFQFFSVLFWICLFALTTRFWVLSRRDRPLIQSNVNPVPSYLAWQSFMQSSYYMEFRSWYETKAWYRTGPCCTTEDFSRT
jgi:hypothetical protein